MNDKNFEKAETEYNHNYDPYGEDACEECDMKADHCKCEPEDFDPRNLKARDRTINMVDKS